MTQAINKIHVLPVPEDCDECPDCDGTGVCDWCEGDGCAECGDSGDCGYCDGFGFVY